MFLYIFELQINNAKLLNTGQECAVQLTIGSFNPFFSSFSLRMHLQKIEQAIGSSSQTVCNPDTQRHTALIGVFHQGVNHIFLGNMWSVHIDSADRGMQFWDLQQTDRWKS